jgi:hypothetical protein
MSTSACVLQGVEAMRTALQLWRQCFHISPALKPPVRDTYVLETRSRVLRSLLVISLLVLGNSVMPSWFTPLHYFLLLKLHWSKIQVFTNNLCSMTYSHAHWAVFTFYSNASCNNSFLKVYARAIIRLFHNHHAHDLVTLHNPTNYSPFL